MDDVFFLDKEKEYLIYGAGGGGLKLIQVFEKRGYHLKGFIDKRAAALGNVRGKSVWTLDTLEELRTRADNIVIIITTKNVFDHSAIVDELAKKGFRQCIYKPLPILKGYFDEELEKISRLHDVFLVDIDIPQVQALAKVQEENKMYYRDNFVISHTEESTLAWMPLELLFNYKESDAYEKLSMAVFFPLENLYRLFLGNAHEKKEDILSDFYDYASEWAHRNCVHVDNELKRSWLASRKDAFSQMQEISDYNFDFFYRNAPQAEMTDLGKFYLTNSGRNRVVFLAAKGYRCVPVKMPAEDYTKWLNKEAFLTVKHFIEQEHITKVYAPVAHPYFKDLPSQEADYYRLVCYPIARFLYQNIYHAAGKIMDGYSVTDKKTVHSIIENYSILCDMNDDGSCSRYLDLCGFKVYRTKHGKPFTKLLDTLFYQDIVERTDMDTGTCELLITDDYQQLEYKIMNGTANQIICIEPEHWNRVCLEKFGYVRKNTLSWIFGINGYRYVNVYQKGSRK